MYKLNIRDSKRVIENLKNQVLVELIDVRCLRVEIKVRFHPKKLQYFKFFCLFHIFRIFILKPQKKFADFFLTSQALMT